MSSLELLFMAKPKDVKQNVVPDRNKDSENLDQQKWSQNQQEKFRQFVNNNLNDPACFTFKTLDTFKKNWKKF